MTCVVGVETLDGLLGVHGAATADASIFIFKTHEKKVKKHGLC